MKYGFTLQIPSNARVTDLSMSTSRGCTFDSQVKPLKEAEEDFDDSLMEGKPAAILKAWNSTNYPIEVSIPAFGRTFVQVSYEELLLKKKEKLKFQVPFLPGVAVEDLSVDITIKEHGGIQSFEVTEDSMNVDSTKGTAHVTLKNLPEEDARMIDASYSPGPLSPSGSLIIPDETGKCLLHLFNPESFLDAMPRNIVFVIDVSGSMYGQKMDDAKAAFKSMISTLQEFDSFVIHSFSDEGIKHEWGPFQANLKNKEDAILFVNQLQTGGATNLHDAYLKGISRALEMQQTENDQINVPIMMILTDGQASSGIMSSKKIASSVKNVNEGNKVKIFALGFGYAADMNLLLGISIITGGVAVRIYEGYSDSKDQMQDFFQEELGSVLLSDVHVHLEGLGINNNENHFMQEDMIMGGTQSMSINKKTKIVWHSGGSSPAPPPPKITMGPLPSPTQHPTFDLNETTLIDIHNDTLANNQTRFLKKEETVFLRQKQTKQESAPIFGSYQVFIPFLLFLLMLFS